MDNETALLIVLAVIGSILIGKGITGYAIISQTCCFSGENCNAENMCEFIKPDYKEGLGLSFFSAISGVSMVILSLVLIHRHLHQENIK